MKPHDSKQKPNSSKAQATVEFALILLVLLAVLYGIIEISRLLFVNVQIENAAREGAHYKALHPSADADCIKDIIEDMLSSMDTSTLSVSMTPPVIPGAIPPLHSDVGVVVTYDWTSLVNFMPDMNSFTLRQLGPLRLSSTGKSLVETTYDDDLLACSGD